MYGYNNSKFTTGDAIMQTFSETDLRDAQALLARFRAATD